MCFIFARKKNRVFLGGFNRILLLIVDCFVLFSQNIKKITKNIFLNELY